MHDTRGAPGLGGPWARGSLDFAYTLLRYASPCLWNQLALFISSSTSFWYQFLHFRLTYSFNYHSFLFWFATLLIPLSFTSGLQPTCFTNPIPRSSTSSFRTAYTDLCPHRFFWANRFLFLIFPYFFVSVPCARLSWPFVRFWAHINISYRVVSYSYRSSANSELHLSLCWPKRPSVIVVL